MCWGCGEEKYGTWIVIFFSSIRTSSEACTQVQGPGVLSWDFSRLQLALKSHLSKAKWFGGSPPSTRSPFLLRPALTSHQGRQRGGGCCFPSLHLLLVPCVPALARSHPGCPCGRRRTARWPREAPPRPLGDRARSRAPQAHPPFPGPAARRALAGGPLRLTDSGAVTRFCLLGTGRGRSGAVVCPSNFLIASSGTQTELPSHRL